MLPERIPAMDNAQITACVYTHTHTRIYKALYPDYSYRCFILVFFYFPLFHSKYYLHWGLIISLQNSQNVKIDVDSQCYL